MHATSHGILMCIAMLCSPFQYPAAPPKAAMPAASAQFVGRMLVTASIDQTRVSAGMGEHQTGHYDSLTTHQLA